MTIIFDSTTIMIITIDTGTAGTITVGFDIIIEVIIKIGAEIAIITGIGTG
jgi:hypothetical protein